MQRVVLVRHEDGPDDDRIVTWLKLNGFQADIRRPFKGDMLGDVSDDVAGTVIHGGMYNSYDTDLHPFLNTEYAWIGAALDAGIPTLGICQGAQMIARHHGAWAGARADETCEFGYYEVRPVPGSEEFLPAPMYVAQSHFHTFDLPIGAVHLAESDAYPNQAFRIGETVYALQFHPEVTIEGFRRWQANKAGKFGVNGAQTQEQQTDPMHRHDLEQARWFHGFLDGFFDGARS